MTPRAANLQGAGLMTLSMAFFAVEDLFLKSAARHLPVGQVMMMMGLTGILVFSSLSRARGEAALPRAFLSPVLLTRSGFEIAGRLFYCLALALTPLSTTSAILQATPLVVIAGAAIVFRERVGPARWIAVTIGFLGVMIILNPGYEGFSPLSLLAVAGMLGFAGRDLATRAAPKVLSNRQLGTIGFAMLMTAGLIVTAYTGQIRLPDAMGLGCVAGAAAFGVAGYHSLTAAMRTGEVGAVTPFRYARLIFALILSTTILGEVLEPRMLIGAALVVLSGLYGLMRRGPSR